MNLMNAKTFDTLFKDRTLLQPSSLRIEAYGNNTSVEVLGRFHAFLRWKGRVYRQLFYVTNANNSPNLAFERWFLHPQYNKALLLCEIDRKSQQVPRKSRSSTNKTCIYLRESKTACWFISSLWK